MNNKDDDNLEKMIFEFCKNDKDIPQFVDKAVEDGLEKCRNLFIKKSKFYYLKRVAIIIICCGLITTGGVFAINYIVSLFTNSTPGVDSAVENGFVHNIDMDFVYDNNIGIKVDSVVMSTTTLDISFLYDCPDYDNVSKINIYDYTITDEEGNLIADVDWPDLLENSITDTLVDSEENIIYGDYYNNSILLKSDEFPNVNKLYFSIRKILIYCNNEEYYIEGNWNFEINFDDDLISETENISASVSTGSEYVKNIESYLNETTFIIDIEFEYEIDEYISYDPENILLIDNNNIYQCDFFKFSNNELHLEFYYGKYNIGETLTLSIKISEEKTINIKLN